MDLHKTSLYTTSTQLPKFSCVCVCVCVCLCVCVHVCLCVCYINQTYIETAASRHYHTAVFMWHFPLVTQSDGDSNSMTRMWLCFLQPVTMMLYLLCWFDSFPMLFKRSSQIQAGKLWARWGKGTLQFTEAISMPSTSTATILEKHLALPFGYTQYSHNALKQALMIFSMYPV